MKTFIFVVAILISAQALIKEQEEKPAEDFCMAEAGVNPKNFTELPNDFWTKFYLCMYKKIGLLNEAGEIQMEAFKVKLNAYIKDQNEVDEVLKKCAVKQKSPGDTAFEIAICLGETVGVKEKI